ncbi:uncharacterized protein LOC121543328 isoform X2 [Coregonus clupeaformis]|uniref:uncharacterized protein LOC121543328 isoform X2 n=1 Tax=Coregonus clupeaformis TaxID=59861 RepID=UPI001E1C81E0|nr:uncharacterized protein LOC121543328 isoform X2 [Coregonus clupeaformis]
MIFVGFLAILTSVQAVSVPTFTPVYELKVGYGDNVTLPCNFSSYLGQDDEGEVRWEAMGQEVAFMEVGNILGEASWDNGAKGAEVKTTLGFSSRVEFPPAERMRDGDFSMTIQETVLSDEEMYECIWQGRKTISTVWLKVQEPDPPRSITLFKGGPVTLPCYGVIPKTQLTSQIYVQWQKDDVEILTLNPGPDDKGPKEEDLRLSLPPNNLLENGDLSLFIYKTELKDQGVYRCFYKSRGFEDPKSGIPEAVSLTILDPYTDLYNLTGRPTQADLYNLTGRPTQADLYNLTGRPTQADLYNLTGRPTQADLYNLTGRPTQADLYNLTGRPTQADLYNLTGRPTQADLYNLTGRPTQADLYNLTGRPTQADLYNLTGRPTQADLYNLTGRPTQADLYNLTGRPTQADLYNLTGRPTQADLYNLTGRPTQADLYNLTGRPTQADLYNLTGRPTQADLYNLTGRPTQADLYNLTGTHTD